MNQQLWKKINKIVDTALELKKEKRKIFIQEQCQGDQQLKQQVNDLLISIEQSDSENFLENTADYPKYLAQEISEENIEEESTTLIGTTIGRYKIIELIEHGGMGSVYRAERADEIHSQRVALKLMRRGMDTPSNIARFKRERKILAKLNHPHIARLIDGGVTDNGLPYLVMEYVEGKPLYDYCDDHNLSVNQRLELFKSICEALHHAHNNAIIHRDLKPSNLLVTEEGQVKILDFGIAKLLEPEDPESNIFETQTGARILTLGYAAPEQVEYQAVTTKTDIYILGILLYELLAGLHPFDIAKKKMGKIEQLICHKTPLKPSKHFRKLDPVRQQKIAQSRDLSPDNLIKKLKGDFDAIVMKALRKEPEARYNAVSQLLEDLERKENNRPIIARKDTFRYKSRKFIKRHKTGLSVAAGFLLLIIGFFSFYTWQITEERNMAEQQAEKAQQISGFLVDVFEAGNPDVAEGDTVTAVELLEKGVAKVNQLENNSIKSEMLTILGRSYTGLGEYETASDLLERAINLSKQAESGDNRITHANALYSLGSLHAYQQDFEKSVPLLRKAYNIQSEEVGHSDPQTIRTLTTIGVSLRNTGKLDSAEYYVRKALDIQNNNSSVGSDSLLLKTQKDLAYILRKKGDHGEAEKLYKEIIEEIGAESNSNQSDLNQVYNNLAYLYNEQEEYEKAEEYYKKALRLSSQIRGDSHPITNMIRSNYASALAVNNKFEEAENLFKENIKLKEERYTKNHWRTGQAYTTVGYFLIIDKKAYEDAKSYIKEGIQIYEDVLGPEHLWTGYAKGLLTATEYMKGNHGRSDSLFIIHYNIFKENADSLDSTNKGQIQNLIDIYTSETDTSNKRFVNAYEKILANR